VKRAVLVYGAAGGLPIAVLRLLEYRFLVIEHPRAISHWPGGHADFRGGAADEAAGRGGSVGK
jgi:hypothetical protein